MKNDTLMKRVGYAMAGIRTAWRSEQSLRIHTWIACAVMVVMLLLRPPLIWWALVGGMIALILAMELLNTTVEHLADHLHPEEHPRIRLVKDCAAAAVLVLSLGAVWVGILMVVAVVLGK